MKTNRPYPKLRSLHKTFSLTGTRLVDFESVQKLLDPPVRKMFVILTGLHPYGWSVPVRLEVDVEMGQFEQRPGELSVPFVADPSTRRAFLGEIPVSWERALEAVAEFHATDQEWTGAEG